MNKISLFFLFFICQQCCIRMTGELRNIIIYPKKECKKYADKLVYKLICLFIVVVLVWGMSYFLVELIGMTKRTFDIQEGVVKNIKYIDKTSNSKKYNIIIRTNSEDEMPIENVYAEQLEVGDSVVICSSSNQYLRNIVAERNGEVCQYYQETYGSNCMERILLFLCTLIGIIVQIRFMKREIYKEENVGFVNILQILWKGGLIFYCVVMLLCVLNVSRIPHLDKCAAVSFATYITSSLLYLLIVGKRQVTRMKTEEEWN